MPIEVNIDEAVTNEGEEKTYSTGERARKPQIEDLHEGVATLIFELLSQAEGQEFEVKAFADDAEEEGRVLSEELKEELELPDEVETFSFEDFFQVDMSEYDYFGNPPRERTDEGTSIPEEWSERKGNGAIINDAKNVLNGYYAGPIQERFGGEEATAEEPDVYVAIRSGKKKNHESPLEQRQHAVFYVQDTDNTAKYTMEAREAVGEITESELEEWLDGWEDNEE